jgi:zinc/manganese transport system substrate-binding protein
MQRGFLLLLFTATLSGCMQPTTLKSQPTAASKKTVVVSFSILGDWVKNIAGERVHLHVLVGRDGDAHTYEPSPRDAVLLGEADLIIENGAGFEPWLENVVKASGSKALRLNASEGIQYRLIQRESDPHLWHDVVHAQYMVSKIADTLIQLDPRWEEEFRARATTYHQELSQLHDEMKRETSKLPKERRRLVTNHDTFAYFAARYDFLVVGNLLNSLSTEAGEPSPSKVVELIRSIKEQKVPAVFAENIHQSKLLARVAQEAGVKLAPPLYSDALGPIGTSGETYLKLMRHNLKTISQALSD